MANLILILCLTYYILHSDIILNTLSAHSDNNASPTKHYKKKPTQSRVKISHNKKSQRSSTTTNVAS